METRVRESLRGQEKGTESSQEGKSFGEGPAGARSKQRWGREARAPRHAYSPGFDWLVVSFYGFIKHTFLQIISSSIK